MKNFVGSVGKFNDILHDVVISQFNISNYFAGRTGRNNFTVDCQMLDFSKEKIRKGAAIKYQKGQVRKKFINLLEGKFC